MKPQATSTPAPPHSAAVELGRNVSDKVKVWPNETSTEQAHNAPEPEPANPIFILGAITLGIPALLTIPLIGLNPGLQEGAFTGILTFFVISAFVIAAVFEIKRIADQPSDSDHH